MRFEKETCDSQFSSPDPKEQFTPKDELYLWPHWESEKWAVLKKNSHSVVFPTRPCRHPIRYGNCLLVLKAVYNLSDEVLVNNTGRWTLFSIFRGMASNKWAVPVRERPGAFQAAVRSTRSGEDIQTFEDKTWAVLADQMYVSIRHSAAHMKESIT